ncbi:MULTISPECIES: RusA family crossover junction endodeoxyribonuclease [Aeromonas]|uniref:Crossover junction endodeoxyribonuclease rusA n=1 Tax=Aeromonas caviae TaxID=648 RepID=A0AA42R4A8_AERCA|nr:MULTISPECIES: RusA family crossover junction endodeoxyribonuclease [Aeromonas]AHX60508.1 endodeoxyribonuclease RUS [Aeromonas media WS]MDH1503524.1 RusA family crossover junction endodeoxyribonuclease [Aeromonas caviae]MDH1805984.1 RusA family crossover junction endodeoxyribonuclease [Aeromonas caviae]MDY7841561.1 RusA family crossover junction endodeoxyribonuclease [Aeromonas caviae]MEA9421278.1 RusA family crossover junction endodeoxyribonuclease [Aeromonas caviae]
MPKADSWTVTLPWPPSTNRIWRNVAVSGKPRTLLSQEGRVYRKAAADACLVAKLAGKQIPDRLALRLVVQAPDRRARDLDNTVKAVQDALTHAGVWLDDSQIDRLLVERGPVVKGGMVSVTVEVMSAL